MTLNILHIIVHYIDISIKMANSQHRYASDNKLFIAFLMFLVWIPLPLGSNRPWAVHLLEILSFGLCIWWLALFIVGKTRMSKALAHSRGVFWPLGGFAFVILFQLLPMPIGWVAALRVVDPLLESSTLLTISIDPYTTWVHFRTTLAFIGIAFLMLALINSPSRLKQFAIVLLISGVFQGVYGGLMTLSGVEYGFFIKKWTYIGNATGTFVNRNHLANYLIMTLAVGTGLLLSDLYQQSSKDWRERRRRLVQAILGHKIKIRIGLALMVIALVLTKSRMGNTAFFFSLIGAGFLWLIVTKRVTKGSLILLVSLILIDTIIVGTWFGIDKVRERLEGTAFTKETRDEVNRDTWHLIQQQPLFGTGAGTYYTAYPKYKQGDTILYYDHAHNDYFQFLTEHGVVGVGLLMAFVLLSLKNTLLAMRRRKTLLYQAMGFVPLMSIMAIAMHSLVDFSLQIPANATVFICVLCLGWVVRFTPSKNAR